MNVFLNKAVAESYDNYYTTRQGIIVDAIEKKIISKFLAKIPPSEMLELGCGTGHWTSFFVESGFNVIATDISDEMLNIAKQKNLTGIKFQKADATCLPFSEASFKVVSSITMLEFTDNIMKIFTEINRILLPGGWLLLGCLNKNSELGKIKGNDEVFKKATFFSTGEIITYLSEFGVPEVEQCVYFSPTFEILDNSPLKSTVEGSFIVASVQKTK